MKKFYCFMILCLFSANLLIINQPLPFLQAQTETGEEDFRVKMNEGLELVKRGRYQEAKNAFELALKLNPPSDLLRFLRDEMGHQIILEMYANPELRDVALRIMELSKGAKKRFERSPEQIMTLVNDLDEDFDKRFIAINTLVSIGQRACPYLLEQLAEGKNDDMQFGAIQCLEKMGKEAVLPVIEALNSPNQSLRQNAALILGTIKDERALAELKRIYEDPKEQPEVKTYVADALKRITGRDVETLNSALEYYYLLAEKYYYSHPSVMINFYGDYIVWRWDKTEDKLTIREVPDFTFNEELAEEAAYDGLKIDNNYGPLWPLLVCIYLSAYNESQITLESASQKHKQGAIDQELFDKLQKDLIDAKNGLFLGQMGSRVYLYQALQRSLTDQQVPVAVSCIKALKHSALTEDLPGLFFNMPSADELSKMSLSEQETWQARKKQWEQESRTKIGQPLVDALVYPDKRVRYAAADLLLKINPRQQFLNYEQVIPLIIEALGESGIRVVLIIEDDGQVRNGLKLDLKNSNCYAIEATTATEGLKRAKQFPSEDLIILSSKIASQITFLVNYLDKEVSETVFDSLKEDIRTRGVPIFILTAPEELDTVKKLYEGEANVKGFLTKPVDKLLLKSALEETFSSEEAQKDSKTRAEEVSREAVEALASLELTNVIYSYLDTVDGLVQSLENRPDQIRLPAIKTLGRFRDTRAIPALGKVFANQENTKEIRLAACTALSEIFKTTPQPIPQDLYEILKTSLERDEFEIQQRIAQIYGNAQLTPEQRRELFELKRIHK
ncbi:MAG: HEAT repeat domain-containing protein [Planctomycetota bacterium]